MLGVIALCNGVAGGDEPVEQGAVICQQEETLSLLVQPADGAQAQGGVGWGQQVHDGFVLTVLRGGEISGGLVQQQDDPLRAGQGLAVDADRVPRRVDLPGGVQNRRAVAGDASGADALLPLLAAQAALAG